MVITPYSITAYFALSVAFLMVAFLIRSSNPFYRRVQDGTSNYLAVDGFRGFLALGVFFHHSLMQYSVIRSRFYIMVGEIGVGFFFIITAFLFWGKVINYKQEMNWTRLYESRIKRIVPMYFVSVIIFITIIIYRGLVNNVALFSTISDFSQTIKQLLRFAYFVRPVLPIEDAFTGASGVIWTLAWEWKFYLVLPFLSLFKSTNKFIFFGVLALLCFSYDGKFVYCFLAGMLAAEFQRRAHAFKLSKKQLYVHDVIFIICVGILLVFF